MGIPNSWMVCGGKPHQNGWLGVPLSKETSLSVLSTLDLPELGFERNTLHIFDRAGIRQGGFPGCTTISRSACAIYKQLPYYTIFIHIHESRTASSDAVFFMVLTELLPRHWEQDESTFTTSTFQSAWPERGRSKPIIHRNFAVWSEESPRVRADDSAPWSCWTHCRRSCHLALFAKKLIMFFPSSLHQ